MNTNKIKQIFCEAAKEVAESMDSEALRAESLSSSIPMIRGGKILPERAAETYVEALDRISALAGADGTWSRLTVDDVLWEYIERILQVSPEERPATIRSQGNEIVRRFSVTPTRWAVDLLVYGMDASCANRGFGGLTFLSDDISVDEPLRPLLGKLLETRQMFARLETTAIDEQSAIHRASDILDEHLAILNFLCALGHPSLVRVSRVDHIDQTNDVHRIGKSVDSMGPLGFRSATIRIPLLGSDLDRVLNHTLGVRISQMLSAAENDFSKRVLSGYALAGAACVDAHPERRFLMFAIALESVVLGRDTKSELTYQLATRVAHLIGNGPSGRKHVSLWVNNLYDRRSKIVHTGEYGVSRTESGLIQFYCMATLANLALLKSFDAFTTNEQLEGWFKERMLEGPQAGRTTWTETSEQVKTDDFAH
jgi:hypothetical protein